MKTLRFLTLTFPLLFSTVTKAQFTVIKSVADSLLEIGDLNGAIIEYRKIYNAKPKDENNIYNFACAFASLNQTDSCFKYLSKSIELDTSTYPLTDPDFLSIRSDKRWDSFEIRLISMLNIKFNNPYKDVDYAKKLWLMKAKDQACYKEINLVENKFGRHSTVVRALWELKHIYNQENQKQLESLIKEKGWPKISIVGSKAAGAAFLIIQHSDINSQKLYLPTIEKLCREKEADWQSYALMYDRIQTAENKPQKYGSQIRFNEMTQKYELFPLIDENMVDKWRAEIGMEPLSDYVAIWGIIFEPRKK